MRSHGGRRLRREALLTVLVASGLLLGLASSPVAADTGHGSSGSFTFSGVISGRLKVPAYLPSSAHADCSITASNLRTDTPDTDVFNWSHVKLRFGDKTKKVAFIDLQIQVSRFGRSQVMSPNDGASNSVFFSTGALYNWLSQSGTITTAKGGTSGTVVGTLSAGTNHPGTLTIKGHWTGCTILSN
jgi:hypothetical protein